MSRKINTAEEYIATVKLLGGEIWADNGLYVRLSDTEQLCYAMSHLSFKEHIKILREAVEILERDNK